MNVELLRKIAAVIQEKPAQFNMRFLHIDKRGRATSSECGTAHCIAGWGELLLGESLGAWQFGLRIGIDDEATARLCFENRWPEKFLGRYRKAKLPKTKSRIAAARIEHFIATGGAE